MKVYEGILKYMEVYKVYPDILKDPPEGREGREGKGREKGKGKREGRQKGKGREKGKREGKGQREGKGSIVSGCHCSKAREMRLLNRQHNIHIRSLTVCLLT